MPAEVEAKFRADSPEVLEALAATPALGFATLGPAATADEIDRYLDTADGRLAAARWACRVRLRDGAVRVSLKGAAESPGGDAWHHRRPELEGPATDSTDPAAWPPSAARDRLDALRGGQPLVERFALRQRRTERPVLADGRVVGTLSLDAVEVAGEPDGGPLLVVELELAGEDALDARRFAELADALLARGGLRPDPRTKLEHALERLAAR